MRVLWHGVAPWQPTGYGQQAAIWCRKLRDAGHTVAVSAQGGNDNCQVMKWEGIDVYPIAKDLSAVLMVNQGNLARFAPDLVIVCYDPWQMGRGDEFADFRTLAWVPVDTTHPVVGGKPTGYGIAVGDYVWLDNSKAQPVAMSRHGQRMLTHARQYLNLPTWEDVPYIPHGIDTQAFAPLTPERRDRLRAQLGIGPDTFAVGCLGMNNDHYRKAVAEQMIAFARFHGKHPDSQLHLHAQVYLPGSVHLGNLAGSLGLGEADVKIANQYAIFTGTFPQSDLAMWYACMDVVMNCSRAEGFGLAGIEAQACGTPVILTNAHTGPELVGPGWLVPAQEFWNERHQALWWTPSIRGIYDALCRAKAEAAGKRDEARAFAEQYDIEQVWPLWEKLLAEL